MYECSTMEYSITADSLCELCLLVMNSVHVCKRKLNYEYQTIGIWDFITFSMLMYCLLLGVFIIFCQKKLNNFDVSEYVYRYSVILNLTVQAFSQVNISNLSPSLKVYSKHSHYSYIFTIFSKTK